ncbi:DUF805 domain-containing protein [Anaerovibrio sp.]|uniref:DUF805 domain-containing protein n=1 Tax=Anaerovibrio sp. TaxID=1872532 RepID=UPI003F149A85
MLNRFIGGRLNRKKYIMYYLATIAASVFLMMIFGAAMLATGQLDYVDGGTMYMGSLAVGVAANLVAICLGIRRLHDLGKGGCWTLAVILPSVFSFSVYFIDDKLIVDLASALDIIVLLALAVLKGNDGANEFGPAS